MSYYAKSGISQIRAFHPHTQKYIAAMTTAPTVRVATAIDRFILNLVKDSLFSAFDCFYLFKMHDSQSSRVNLVNPGTDTMSITGSPTHTAGGYWVGAASGYLQTTTLMSAMTKFTQDNAALGCFFEDTGTQNVGACGNSSNNNELRNNGYGMCNAAYVFGEAYRAATAGVIGHKVCNRPSSTVYNHFMNGAKSGADNSTASVAVAATQFRACGGINGTSSAQVSVAHCGRSLTDTEISNLYNHILTYRSDY